MDAEKLLKEYSFMIEELVSVVRCHGNVVASIHRQIDNNNSKDLLRSLEEHAFNDIESIIKRKSLIEEGVRRLSRPTSRLLIRSVYIEGLKIKEVSKIIGLSERQAYRLHKESIEELQQIFLSEYFLDLGIA